VTATEMNENSFSCVASPGLSLNVTAREVTGLANGTPLGISHLESDVSGNSDYSPCLPDGNVRVTDECAMGEITGFRL
jgi:hypothetical protein